MYIPNVNNKLPFCRLQLVVETQLNKQSNQNSMKIPKVVKPTNRKMLL